MNYWDRYSSLSLIFLLDSLKIQRKTKEEAKYYFCNLEITTEEDKARSWWFDLWTQCRKYASAELTFSTALSSPCKWMLKIHSSASLETSSKSAKRRPLNLYYEKGMKKN